MSRTAVALWLLCVVAAATVGADGPLWDEDEAAYAGFARTMVSSGDWVVPAFPYSRIHRKPPFHFWAVATSLTLFGEHNWAVRLPNWVAFTLLLLTLWRGLGPVASRAEGQLAVVVQGSSLLVLGLLRVSVTDAWLLLFTTWAVVGVLWALEAPGWRANTLLWGGVSLGVLTKGPPVLIVAGGVWFMMALVHHQRRHLVATHPWFYLPVALLPMGVWVWATMLRDGGELATFLWDWYVAKRVGGSVLGQRGWPGYHAVVLLVCFLPFLSQLLPALVQLVRRWREPWSMGIIGWLLFGWVFFEVMSSKLPTYSLAAQPALALLVARSVLRGERPWSWLAVLVTGLVALGGAGLLAAWPMLASRWPHVAALGLAPQLGSVLLVGLGLLSLAAWAGWRGRLSLAVALQALCWPATVACAVAVLLPALDASPLKGTQQGWVSEPGNVILWVQDPAQRQPSLALAAQRHSPRVQVVDSAHAARLAVPGLLVSDEGGRAALEAMGLDFSEARARTWWDTDHDLKPRTVWVLRVER